MESMAYIERSTETTNLDYPIWLATECWGFFNLPTTISFVIVATNVHTAMAVLLLSHTHTHTKHHQPPVL